PDDKATDNKELTANRFPVFRLYLVCPLYRVALLLYHLTFLRRDIKPEIPEHGRFFHRRSLQLRPYGGSTKRSMNGALERSRLSIRGQSQMSHGRHAGRA